MILIRNVVLQPQNVATGQTVNISVEVEDVSWNTVNLHFSSWLDLKNTLSSWGELKNLSFIKDDVTWNKIKLQYSSWQDLKNNVPDWSSVKNFDGER